MKRIAQILIQISNSKRDDISSQINQRFDSLKKLGVECSPDLNCDVVVPNMPKNMNFVIQHSDVEVIKQIGKGQSGTVSLGKFKGNEVAVKILYRRALSQPELESFRREIVVLSLLDYPSVLKFYGYTEDPPFYILTDYMPNGSLFDFLRKSPEKLTPTCRTLIALDVARGLKYLHSKNIIHRDMKSLNVLLDSNLRAKICDFGMVRLKQNAPMTGLIGTPHWMAPEVFMSLPSYDEKVDVFSYGILLWELLTNDMPYNGMKQVDITIGVTQGTLRPPLPPGPPSKLTKLIEQCWAQDPKDRPTMTQVVTEIEHEPKYHFPGTDETLFRSLLAKPKHRSTSSQVISHKKKRSGKRLSGPSKLIDNIDEDDNTENITENDLSMFKIVDIISKIESSTGDERQNCLKELCECITSDKKTTDEIAKTKNGCKYISECLSNDELSEICLKNLKKCKSDSIFDVDVLKALLQFSNNEDQKFRELALSDLIEASKLRFDFLVSAPSFLLNLLYFLKKPTSSNLSCELLHLARKLLKMFANVPEGIIQILINIYKNNDQKDAQKDALKCINTALKFDSVRNEMNGEMWDELLTNDSFKESIFDSFCDGLNRSSSDPIFLRKFLLNLQPKTIEPLLPKIFNNSRFTTSFFEILPIRESKKKDASNNENDSEKSSSIKKQISFIYKVIIKECSWMMPKITSEAFEFYQISAYFINHHKVEFICDVLKKTFQSNTINMKLLLKSKLCETLFESFLEATKVDDLFSIMAVIFNIFSTITGNKPQSEGLISFLKSNSKAEANLFSIMNSSLVLQKLFLLLFCEKEIYRMPSFMCISSIALAKQKYNEDTIISSPPLTKTNHSTNEGIEVEKLLCAAAFFVNSELSLPREFGNKIIQSFIGEKNLNLMQIAKIFVGNFKVSDENTRCAANAIIDASQKDQILDDDILQMVMAISEKE